MITIPVAAPNKLFQWQSSLFQFAQEKIYGADSRFNSLVLIADRNNHSEIVKDVNWNLRIPYKIVNGIHTILDKEDTHPYFAAGNVFFALKELIKDTNITDYICITDCDVIPLKKYIGILPGPDEVITCNHYEDWHMHLSRPGKLNYNVVEPYLKHDTHEYMDGGFVPIIIQIETLKKIIDEVIDLSIKIVREYLNHPFGWWMQMWAFQIACHNNHIKCIGQDNTYFPHMNELNLEKHYFAHYSCDPKFSKGTFPNHNIGEFPHNNVFYDTIREWYYR
jgi:hypothetical protein